jgi:mRNA-degrading endonuclease RelE of RelBE toxin-antitoxin system
MAFLLADSFQSSLDKLSGEEQKAAKLAAFELQINPANPGLQCHRHDNIRDKNFWSARASRDLRLIFHRVESSLMLCYIDHHVPTYDWASRARSKPIPSLAPPRSLRSAKPFARSRSPSMSLPSEQRHLSPSGRLSSRKPTCSATA